MTSEKTETILAHLLIKEYILTFGRNAIMSE
jgi:hypothetical protein